MIIEAMLCDFCSEEIPMGVGVKNDALVEFHHGDYQLHKTEKQDYHICKSCCRIIGKAETAQLVKILTKKKMQEDSMALRGIKYE